MLKGMYASTATKCQTQSYTRVSKPRLIDWVRVDSARVVR
jgi:hypothetical protein